jgi:hypothetical protein
MKWLCKLLGHQCQSIQSKELVSWVPGGPGNHWCWPGVVTFCPRCGFLFQGMGGPPDKPPF